MRRAAVQHLAFAVACGATVLVAAGLIIRLTIRDAEQPFAAIYYGLQFPVLSGISAALAGYWSWRRARILAALLAVTCAGTLVAWLRVGWHWAPETNARADLRFVQWNADRPDWRLAGDARWLRSLDADVLTIAERYPRKMNLLAEWRAAFPEYQLAASDDELLCLVRGEIVAVEDGHLQAGSFATVLRTRVRGHDLTVIQADIQAFPLIDRRVPLQQLAKLIAAHRSENLVVAGDFNTPLDSIFLDDLRAQTDNAFEAAGRGCAATWPRPFPVLSLDQIWASKSVRAVRCRNVMTWRSDHRAVIADFAFAP